MENIVIQPAGKVAQKNYEETIQNAVDIERVKYYVDEMMYKKIKRLYPDGKIYIWGVKNGKNNTTKNKWVKMKSGDIVLFYKDKRIFKRGVVTKSFINPDLAEELWGQDEDGETWENIYLVDELTNLELEFKEFAQIAGYKENYVVHGFEYLNDDKSKKIFEALDILSDTVFEDVSREEYQEEIRRLMEEESLDKKTNSMSRKEHAFLKKILFKDKTEWECGICGKKYPVELLVVAHIKKRSECTNQERLDAENIVMPM